jgi:N-methylhydantoinase B
MYRAIQVTATPGSIVNCVSPAAVSWRTQVAQRVVDLVHGALAQAVPGGVTAAHNGATTGMEIYGTNPLTGGYYFHYESLGGGFGARATKDGLDGVQVHVTNTTNLPIEALEMEFPILADRLELVADSGGPGRFRGGMGFERSYRVVRGKAATSPSMTRRLSQPWGLFGGLGGAPARLVVRRGDGSEEDVTRRSDPLQLEEGDAVAVFTPGAGGYGDPRERDRAQVVRDLREGRISRRAAIETYGLGLEEAGLALNDRKGTAAD